MRKTPVATGIMLDDGTPALLVISDRPLHSKQVVRLLTEGIRQKLAQVGTVLEEEVVGEIADGEYDVVSLATRYGWYELEDHPRLRWEDDPEPADAEPADAAPAPARPDDGRKRLMSAAELALRDR